MVDATPGIPSYLKRGDRIGTGGMAEVYAAESYLYGKVAIKVQKNPTVLLLEGAGSPRETLPSVENRIEHESHVLNHFQLHPKVVKYLYSGKDDHGVPFLVMERIDGENLETLIKEGLAPDKAIAIAISIAHVADFSHSRGIVLRDIKPRNVMMRYSGEVICLDFGLAKIYDHELLPPHLPGILEQEGTVIGTVSYMSPEALQGEQIDSRSDIYSLGVTLYEMLTGKHPQQINTTFSDGPDAQRRALFAIIRDDPVPLSKIVLGIDPHLEKIVHKTLEKDPNNRYRNMQEVMAALESVNIEGWRTRVTGNPRMAKVLP